MTPVVIAQQLGIWFVLSSAILAVAAIAVRLIRGQASARHLIWCVAFGALLLAPVLATILPGHTYLAAKSDVIEVVEAPLALESELVTTEPPTPTPFDWTPLARIATFVWIGGAAIITLRIGLGAFEAHRLRRAGLKCDPEEFGLENDATGLRRRWELRVSRNRRPPAAMTWGSILPVVLLPREAPEWSVDRSNAVLRHELAHVRRFDSLTQMAAYLACAFYWFNPLVWVAAKAMRAEAEIAADDAVILSGVKPVDYAEELLRLATEFGVQRQPLTLIGVSVMKHSPIESRILSLVDPNTKRRGLARLEVLSVATSGLVLALAFVSVRPALAQDTSKAPIPSAPVVQGKELPAPKPSSVPSVPGVPAATIAPGAPASAPVLAQGTAPAIPAVPAKVVEGVPAPMPPQIAKVKGKKLNKKARAKLQRVKSVNGQLILVTPAKVVSGTAATIAPVASTPAKEEVYITTIPATGVAKGVQGVTTTVPAKVIQGQKAPLYRVQTTKGYQVVTTSKSPYKVALPTTTVYSAKGQLYKVEPTARYKVSTIAPMQYKVALTSPQYKVRTTTPATTIIGTAKVQSAPATVPAQKSGSTKTEEVRVRAEKERAAVEQAKGQTTIEVARVQEGRIQVERAKKEAAREVIITRSASEQAKNAVIEIRVATEAEKRQAKKSAEQVKRAKAEADKHLAKAKQLEEQARIERKRAEEARQKAGSGTTHS